MYGSWVVYGELVRWACSLTHLTRRLAHKVLLELYISKLTIKYHPETTKAIKYSMELEVGYVLILYEKVQ